MSIREANQREVTAKERYARVWAFWQSSNLVRKYFADPFVRIVAMPASDSDKKENIGERDRPSNLFSSLVVLTKVSLSLPNRQIKNGMMIKTIGKTVDDTIIPPSTTQKPTEKS